MKPLLQKAQKLTRRVRGWIRPPAMPYVFMSAGGSGSSFVNSSLRSFGVRIAERPDVMLRPSEIDDLDGRAPLPARTMFSQRSLGFTMDGERSIEANLLDYLKFLEARPNHTALFSNIPAYEFFRRNHVRNVVLLVRNPIQAYISFAKPERHQDLVEEWGGAFTEPSLRAYGEYWVTFVREYLALRDLGLEPGLLRYETLRDDAEALGIAHLFPEWRRSRNPVSEPRAAEFLRSFLGDEYLQVYPDWEM